MEILTTNLPSGGFGYDFPSINISPLNFLQIIKYRENCPQDPLEKYLYNIRMLMDEEPKIGNCYLMDLDFIIFLKQLITVSEDMTSYNITVNCPYCGKPLRKKISLEKDIQFKQIDSKIMRGSQIRLGDTQYETIVPTVNQFMKVLQLYTRYRSITDLDIIKILSLFSNFEVAANKIEAAVQNATHSDITLLKALQDLYFDRLEGIEIVCPGCSKNEGERRSLTVSVSSLIVDFFRDIYINSPINESKIVFK